MTKKWKSSMNKKYSDQVRRSDVRSLDLVTAVMEKPSLGFSLIPQSCYESFHFSFEFLPSLLWQFKVTTVHSDDSKMVSCNQTDACYAVGDVHSAHRTENCCRKHSAFSHSSVAHPRAWLVASYFSSLYHLTPCLTKPPLQIITIFITYT